MNRQKWILTLIDRTQSMEEISYQVAHISRNGGPSQEIRRRIAIAKSYNLNKIWKDRHITTTTKCKNTLVVPIALYAAESWTLKAINIAKLDAFEMWVWRRLLRIPWFNRTACRTNVSILEEEEEVNIQGRLSTKIQIFWTCQQEER